MVVANVLNEVIKRGVHVQIFLLLSSLACSIKCVPQKQLGISVKYLGVSEIEQEKLQHVEVTPSSNSKHIIHLRSRCSKQSKNHGLIAGSTHI